MLHSNIKKWYEKHGRKELPWRNTDNAYRIYISEIMLQQTQVATVLDRFYTPFLQRFPDLTSIKNAQLEDVLKQWEGLGYYTRARNIYKTAQLTAPTLPNTPEKLQELPGIGKNTAHAISAFAYHCPVSVMEANVKRVLTRYYALSEPAEKILWQMADQLLDRNNPFIYNQAMMDIGSMLCTIKSPQCQLCPLAESCQGKESPESYRVKKHKITKKTKYHSIMIYSHEQSVYLTKREDQLLGGLYGFIVLEHQNITQSTDCTKIGHVTQHYSHFTLHADVYHIPMPSSKPIDNKGSWYAIRKINQLPLSAVDIKVMQLFERLKKS